MDRMDVPPTPNTPDIDFEREHVITISTTASACDPHLGPPFPDPNLSHLSDFGSIPRNHVLHTRGVLSSSLNVSGDGTDGDVRTSSPTHTCSSYCDPPRPSRTSDVQSTSSHRCTSFVDEFTSSAHEHYGPYGASRSVNGSMGSQNSSAGRPGRFTAAQSQLHSNVLQEMQRELESRMARSARHRTASSRCRPSLSETHGVPIWERLHALSEEKQSRPESESANGQEGGKGSKFAPTVRKTEEAIAARREKVEYEKQKSELTFTPRLANRRPTQSPWGGGNDRNPPLTGKQLYEHLSRSARNRAQEEEEKKQREMRECTFQPRISREHKSSMYHLNVRDLSQGSRRKSVSDRLYEEAKERQRRAKGIPVVRNEDGQWVYASTDSYCTHSHQRSNESTSQHFDDTLNELKDTIQRLTAGSKLPSDSPSLENNSSSHECAVSENRIERHSEAVAAERVLHPTRDATEAKVDRPEEPSSYGDKQNHTGFLNSTGLNDTLQSSAVFYTNRDLNETFATGDVNDTVHSTAVFRTHNSMNGSDPDKSMARELNKTVVLDTFSLIPTTQQLGAARSRSNSRVTISEPVEERPKEQRSRTQSTVSQPSMTLPVSKSDVPLSSAVENHAPRDQGGDELVNGSVVEPAAIVEPLPANEFLTVNQQGGKHLNRTMEDDTVTDTGLSTVFRSMSACSAISDEEISFQAPEDTTVNT